MKMLRRELFGMIIRFGTLRLYIVRCLRDRTQVQAGNFILVCVHLNRLAGGNAKQCFQRTVSGLVAHHMRHSAECPALNVISTLKSLRSFGAFLIFRLEIFSLYERVATGQGACLYLVTEVRGT